MDLECYERIERHEIWNDLGWVNLTWQVWEKTKKNLSASPISLYNRFYGKIDILYFNFLTIINMDVGSIWNWWEEGKTIWECVTTSSKIVDTKSFTTNGYHPRTSASYVKNGESDNDNILLQTLMKRCKAKSTKQTSRKKIKLG